MKPYYRKVYIQGLWKECHKTQQDYITKVHPMQSNKSL